MVSSTAASSAIRPTILWPQVTVPPQAGSRAIGPNYGADLVSAAVSASIQSLQAMLGVGAKVDAFA